MCGGKVAIPPIVKEKRRNSEKRKEKSRDAARCRRSREAEVFSELAHELPLAPPAVAALDKASVMRLTLACLKIKQMVRAIVAPLASSSRSAPDGVCAEGALSGFLLVLNEEGDVLFISEKVEQILGTHHSDMLGCPMSDFLHPCDIEELQSLLTATRDYSAISCFLRFKSALKPPKEKKTTLHLKSDAYQVIHCVGRKLSRGAGAVGSFYLLFVGTPLPHPAHVEVPLSARDVFLSRHTPDMRFTHCDDTIRALAGYESSELIGKSVYTFHHPLDAEALLAAYKTLLQKGQVESGCYRFLCKHGGHVWLVTQATLLCDSAQRPDCVVCLNYVLTKVEHGGQILSEHQVEKKAPAPAKEEKVSNTCAIFKKKTQRHEQAVSQLP